MKFPKITPAEARKAIAALVACVVLLVARGVLPGEVGTIVECLTPLLVAGGVYFAPANAGKPAETDSPAV